MKFNFILSEQAGETKSFDLFLIQILLNFDKKNYKKSRFA